MKNTYQEYVKQISQNMFASGKYKTIMHVPKLVKIVLNIGMGSVSRDKKALSLIMKNLELISGQKPIPTYARRSISQFKVREGMQIGAKVTLRKYSMFEFMKRFIYLAMQRMNDFHGISDKSMDGRGNLSFGINDCSIFYEVPLDNDRSHGMDIAFVTSARNDEEGKDLLTRWHLPIRRINVA